MAFYYACEGQPTMVSQSHSLALRLLARSLFVFGGLPGVRFSTSRKSDSSMK